MILYHYEHCPFCQRLRLFLGFKGIPYTKQLLSYADTKTQEDLIGKRVLPIMDFEDGMVIPESLDILREIEMRVPHPIGFIGPVEARLQWASQVVITLPGYFNLLLPYYLEHYTQEFALHPDGAVYFQSSKEKKRGKTFEELKKEIPQIYEENIKAGLLDIAAVVEDEFIMGPTFSVADCVLAADLSGLRLVPGIELPPEIPAYIKRVEARCGVDLLANKGE
ncbi:MAG: glutathione S-transferase N-terminal domain-containing protein [Candidatus Peregrinibacteria bacterium]